MWAGAILRNKINGKQKDAMVQCMAELTIPIRGEKCVTWDFLKQIFRFVADQKFNAEKANIFQ